MVLRLSPSRVVSSAREVAPCTMHVPQQRPEVVPANLLLAGGGPHQRAAPGPRMSAHRFPVAAALRRASASTLAAISRTTPVKMYFVPELVTHQAHAVVDDGDHRATDHRVDHLALAAEEAGAADHGRADRVEQDVAAAGVRVDRVGPADAEDAADRGHERADHEDRDADPVDRDAGAAGRLGVAADRVDVPAVGGAAQHERPDHQEDRDDRGDDRHALHRVEHAG